jgi:L-2-hydroxyglutarate oxidase LhgO
MDTVNITIVGAGVIGLAIAEELSQKVDRVLVVEKNDAFGRETSSRNSEVIHAGIYYPLDSLKSRLCVEGNSLLYERCAERAIPHRRLGKLIVATTEEECEKLETIKAHAEQNGVRDLTLLGRKQVLSLEPEVGAMAALFSPHTGIIDSHSLMRSLCMDAEDHGTVLSVQSEVTAIRRGNGSYELETNAGEYRFQSKVLINSAGLHADHIAALAGIDIDRKDYRLKYCKGSYFSLSQPMKLNHLVYPVPPDHADSLGIHATPDMSNHVKFGPDSEYVTEIDYSVDETRRDLFYQAIRKYLPAIDRDALQPDMSGIRPKLQGPGEPVRDFIIKDEKENGLPGMINLIGMESPGLTACIAIARYVSSLVKPYL